jgi:hypothetical protein
MVPEERASSIIQVSVMGSSSRTKELRIDDTQM